jgi:hypothetical protein
MDCRARYRPHDAPGSALHIRFRDSRGGTRCRRHEAGAANYVLKTNLARLARAVLRAVHESDERKKRAAKVARLECVRAIQSRISSAVLRIHDTRELCC